MGLVRYAVFCDDGKSESVQRTLTYSKSARNQFFAEKVAPLVKNMGLVLVANRQGNYRADFDVYFTQTAPSPTRVSIVTRNTLKRHGSIMESLEMNDSGKRTRFPEARVASKADLSNVDKIAAQEGMSRSQIIRASALGDAPDTLILFR
jgi:hypothetical protein